MLRKIQLSFLTVLLVIQSLVLSYLSNNNVNNNYLGSSTVVSDSSYKNPLDFVSEGTLNNKFTTQIFPAGGSVDLLNIPTGQSGVVKEIQYIMESSSADADSRSMKLNIAYDGEASPTVSVPIGVFVGYENTSAVVANTYDTPFFSVFTRDNDDNFNFAILIKYPIPYTNGIRIYLTSSDAGITPTLWCNVLYQDKLSYGWNRNLRLKVSRTDENVAGAASGAGTVAISGVNVTGSGSSFTQAMVGKYLNIGFVDYQIISVTDGTHMTIASTDSATVSSSAYKISESHTFINRPAGKKGYLVATYGGFDSAAANIEYLEANVRIYINGSSQNQIEYSGTEDYFMGAFYWAVLVQNSVGGIVCFSAATGITSAYRIFSTPVRYTNGIIGKHPNVSASAVQYNWTSVYYEEMY